MTMNGWSAVAAAGLAAMNLLAETSEVKWQKWENVDIPVGNDRDGFCLRLLAKRTLSDHENYTCDCAMPYLWRDPDEKGRIVLLCNKWNGDYFAAVIQESRDAGASFTEVEPKGFKVNELCYGLTGIGGGVWTVCDGRYRSTDGAKTWKEVMGLNGESRFGGVIVGWDPLLVVKGSNGRHLINTAYYCRDHGGAGEKIAALKRESFDAGLTWADWTGIPEFAHVSESVMAYNAKGELVAAVRQTPVMGASDDHFAQLATSISTDDGKTWTWPKVVAGTGRHHPSLVLLPDGRMVLSYVVRMGYPKHKGKWAYGIEAVVSKDGGHTWDTDHRYVLARWLHDCILTDEAGNRIPREHFSASPQCTSTVYLPETGELLTAYGTGQNRSRVNAKGRDVAGQVGIVRWRLATDEELASAPKAKPKSPVPAADALAALRANRYWTVNYSAAMGLPDGGWVSFYPEGAVTAADGWLKMNHNNGNWGFFNFRGSDQLEMFSRTMGLRAKILIPDVPGEEGRDVRIAFNSILDTGVETRWGYFYITRFCQMRGTLGDFDLPVKLGKEFTLEIWADKPSRTVRVWVDGVLVGEKPWDIRYMPAETVDKFYFGAGEQDVSAQAWIGYVQFGEVEQAEVRP